MSWKWKSRISNSGLSPFNSPSNLLLSRNSRKCKISSRTQPLTSTAASHITNPSAGKYLCSTTCLKLANQTKTSAGTHKSHSNHHSKRRKIRASVWQISSVEAYTKQKNCQSIEIAVKDCCNSIRVVSSTNNQKLQLKKS